MRLNKLTDLVLHAVAQAVFENIGDYKHGHNGDDCSAAGNGYDLSS